MQTADKEGAFILTLLAVSGLMQLPMRDIPLEYSKEELLTK